MIKVLLILSSALLIATAIFGVLNRQLFVDERKLKNEETEKYKEVNRNLIDTQDALDKAGDELATAKDERDEQDASLIRAQEKLMEKQNAVKELTQTLQEEQLKLKEFTIVLDKIRDADGNIIKIEELKDKHEMMVQELAQATAELQNLEGQVSAENTAVENNQKTIEGHIQTQKDRTASIERNSFEATVTAVNSDWGFVIIDAGQNMGVTADSPLLVSTLDGQRIGKLNIIAIEPTLTVADIDRESIPSGVTIEPGFTVLYEKVAP